MDGFLSLSNFFPTTFLLSGIDLIAAFYGCLYAGCVPVNVRPPHPQNLAATLPTVRMIIDVSVYVLFCTCTVCVCMCVVVLSQVSDFTCFPCNHAYTVAMSCYNLHFRFYNHKMAQNLGHKSIKRLL